MIPNIREPKMEKYFVSENDKSAVRAQFGVCDETARRKVKSLKLWIEQCPHLPLESKDENFLEIMLLRGKFKEDRVRKNIENYFTYLSRYPEMFTGFANLRPVEEVGVAVLLPVPTATWERIAILKLQPDKVGKVLDVHRCLAIGLATAMIAFNYDYTASVRLILDFESFTMRHILQVNINDLFKAISIHENVLKMRISGIEILNAPHVISVILNLAKICLKPKLISRLSVHNNVESLSKSISKKYLPADYGGEQPNIQTLIAMCESTFLDKKDFFQKIERLAEQNQTRGEIFGVQGSFKSLNLD
ncbi:uncharacterized protein LOC659861 [Tribolium castaneum]|uniref:uncharacterized protein LOC659861 n=1 Tax=Tribolium castaneum TaxID=7070 RepID=UPI00046C3087|nr:PREDICTED: uncharacterized protein LOC659861 isoform X2 [Tribolium castaneum]|eukprot:XP_015836608.1 PREDICTED: uncharacterized protein LOC659861 isoform X2 [Tribolium castaneum]